MRAEEHGLSLEMNKPHVYPLSALLICLAVMFALCGCRRTVVRVPTPWGHAWILADVTNSMKIEITVNEK